MLARMRNRRSWVGFRVPEIPNLHYAITHAKTQEDLCTNVLVWLLERCPSAVVAAILRKTGLKLPAGLGKPMIPVQVVFPESIPDAVFQFSDSTCVVLETKRFAEHFNEDQLLAHYRGACTEYGKARVWCVFLSPDRSVPPQLQQMADRHPGRFGFISWFDLIREVEAATASCSEDHRVLFSEFISYLPANLKRGVPMELDELKQFLESYTTGFVERECAARLKLKEILSSLARSAITASGGAAESNEKDAQHCLPHLYTCLSIRDWHIDGCGAYIFIDAPGKKVGLVLTGYQFDPKAKQRFLVKWNNRFADAFAADPRLRTFVFVEAEEDDLSDQVGYFKLIDQTSGKHIEPTAFPEFKHYFYWGYSYDLDVMNLSALTPQVSADFSKLLSTFARPNEASAAKKKKALVSK
jgi:hypothetical protein